jgi:hypothetical protein
VPFQTHGHPEAERRSLAGGGSARFATAASVAIAVLAILAVAADAAGLW